MLCEQLYKKELLSAVSGEHPPHAVLMDSTDAPLTSRLARSAAAQFCMGSPEPELLDLCADYHELDEERGVRVDTVRALTAELSRRAFHEAGRAAFFPRAHLMGAGTQNAFLKTLEEPPPRTLFLLAGNAAALLPTVRSRCFTLHVSASREDIVSYLSSLGASNTESSLYADMGGSMMRAQRLFEDPEYRGLRSAALDIFFQFLSGHAAFANVKQLYADVPSCIDFMLDFAADLVRIRHIGRVTACEDRRDQLESLKRRFTTGELNCIIKEAAAASDRYKKTNSPGTALDGLFMAVLALPGRG